jgi:uncharacterized protein YcnI
MHLRRIALPAATAAAAVVATALPASAHVTVTPDNTAAESYAVLTFSVGHGCEGSPTTRIEIALPEQVLQVTPTRTALWDVEKVTETLDDPVEDAHGNQVTERVSRVVYTARTPLPDGYRDAFELSLQLPDAAGETLTFPVVQKCAKGETAWIETPADGQDAHELERPAPAFEVTAGGVDATATEDGDASTAAGRDNSGSASALALLIGTAGLVVGGLALARTRKRAD